MSTPPSRRLALWAAILSVGLAAAIMAMTIYGGFPSLALAVGLTSALLNAAVSWVALHWRSETRATRVCLVGSVLAGVVGLIAANALARALSGGNLLLDAALPTAMSTTLPSAILGAPPGLVFGALFALPIRRAHRLSRSQAVEANDQALRLSGAWLLGVVLACSLVNALVLDWAAGLATLRGALLLLSALVALLATTVAVSSHLRITRRRRWLERVQSGHEPDWTVLPRSQLGEELEDLQPLFVSAGKHNVVLVRHESLEGGGAYRSAKNLIPWALVHLPEGLAALSFSLPGEETTGADHEP